MERLGLAPEPIVPLDPDWPKMSLEQTKALLIAPGAKFEMATVDIRGVPTRVWKNAPPSLRVLAQMVRAYGAREFTIYEKERVTFEANYRATAHIARQLSEMGVKKGDRVALAMRNLPEWPAIFFAAVSIGAIMVPLNAWWTGGELEYALKDSGARVTSRISCGVIPADRATSAASSPSAPRTAAVICSAPPGFIIAYETRLMRSSPKRICGFMRPAEATSSPLSRSQRCAAMVVEPTSTAMPNACS